MDSSIETGDPWEIPDPEPEFSPPVGGLSPLAEATGLFSRARSVPTEGSPGPAADDEEPQDEEETTLPGQTEGAPDSGLDSEAELFDSSLQGLEEPPAFDLIPPSSFEPVMSEVFPASAQAGDEPDQPVDEAGFASADEPAVVPVHPPATPVYEPPTDTPLDPWADSADMEEAVEIEFGAPQAPEGSELPTGKATVTAGEGTISRPVLLTTETVEGANVAPVDMVVAVESVGDPGAVPAAVERALDALRDRCAEVGGEAVVAVTTSISNTGSVITIVAAGTAVNLL